MDTGRGTLLVVSGAMRRSLRCTAARGSLYFSSELPYFSIHNRGGKVPVTPAMRRYFWAMYYRNVPPEGATGKRPTAKSRTAAYYRSLALTKKTEFDIPRRQVVGDHPPSDASSAIPANGTCANGWRKTSTRNSQK